MTLLTASATDLRARLLAREISAVELLEATFRQVDAVNPTVNAVVGQDRDAARRAAEASDRRIAAGEARPLEGLPITVKDSFDVAGLLSTAGAPMYKERVPATDAAAVARLRQAGAVMFAKSLVPVFTGDFQAYNPLHGIARNPYDPERSPGGSSGGAAAAVAAGLSAFELASDLGGSVRWPAHACGVFGLKTTWNLVPTWGHVPPSPERRPPRNVDLMVAGPIARSAADLDLLLPVLAGPRDHPRGRDAPEAAPPHRAGGPARRPVARRALRARTRGRVDGRAPRRGPAAGGRSVHRRAGAAGLPLRGILRGVLAPQPRHRGLFPAPEGARPAPAGGRHLRARRPVAPGPAGERARA
jgi:amidase